MKNKLMRYIPKEYKDQVADIKLGEIEWDEFTNRPTQTIDVKWKDGEEDTYQNRTFMYEILKEFGRWV